LLPDITEGKDNCLVGHQQVIKSHAVTYEQRLNQLGKRLKTMVRVQFLTRRKPTAHCEVILVIYQHANPFDEKYA
jgi:hypothetical protein